MTENRIRIEKYLLILLGQLKWCNHCQTVTIIDKCNKLYNLTPVDDSVAMKSYPQGDRRACCLCMGINKSK